MARLLRPPLSGLMAIDFFLFFKKDLFYLEAFTPLNSLAICGEFFYCSPKLNSDSFTNGHELESSNTSIII